MCVDVSQCVLFGSLYLHKIQYNLTYGGEYQLLFELPGNNPYIATTHELDACQIVIRLEDRRNTNMLMPVFQEYM